MQISLTGEVIWCAGYREMRNCFESTIIPRRKQPYPCDIIELHYIHEISDL